MAWSDTSTLPTWPGLSLFFTDDTMRNVTGAIDAGMNARHFVDLAGFRRDLADFGLGWRGLAGTPGNPDGEQARRSQAT